MYNYDNPNYRAKVWTNMKYALIGTLLLALLATIAQAQDKIEGIGPFKINVSTVALVEQIAADMKTEIAKVTDDGRSSGFSKVIEYKPNPTNNTLSPYASLCPDARVFFIRYYTVAGINVNDLRLTFYQDRLIELTAKGSTQISEALQAKYGTPVFEKTESRSVLCDGAIEEDYTNRWVTGDVAASTVLSKRYDGRCRNYLTSLLYIYTTKSGDEMRACADIQKNKIDAAKKKTLEDF